MRRGHLHEVARQGSGLSERGWGSALPNLGSPLQPPGAPGQGHPAPSSPLPGHTCCLQRHGPLDEVLRAGLLCGEGGTPKGEKGGNQSGVFVFFSPYLGPRFWGCVVSDAGGVAS